MNSPIKTPDGLPDAIYGVDFWTQEGGEFGCKAWTSFGIYTNKQGEVIAITQVFF